MDLNKLTIKEANEGLKKKEFSAVDLVQACLDQIDKTKDLNSYITVTKDEALKKAKEIDEAGDFSNPLTGIPVGVKDLFCTNGVRTTAASKILENYIPPYSATVVEKLENAGAIMIGKTNLDEFAMGGSNENSAFGPAKNPHDPSRVPGGSSGGSAVSVAANQSIYALGTDTGGSIRQPASFCGVTGLKVTYGRVSRYGVAAYASSFDTIGPLAKTVEDAAIILNTIAGPGPKDSTTPPVAVEDYTANLDQDIKGMRIGVPKEFFMEGMDKEVEAKVKEGIAKLKELGAEIIDVSLPLTKQAIATYYILVKSEASSNLARYDAIRYGSPAKSEDLMSHYLNSRAAGFGSEVKRSIMMGTYTLSAGYFDAYYKKAAKVRTLMIKEFNDVFVSNKLDCMVAPVSPTVAFKIGEKIDDPLAMYLADALTVPINLIGVPSLSIPCGKATPTDGGEPMPVGMQIIGQQFAEGKILQIGHQYQLNTTWHLVA